MADVECPRCGAMMSREGACPVCETPYAEALASRAADHEPAPASPLARWWRSGQLAVALAALCFLGALFLPLLGGVALRTGSSVNLAGSVRPLDLALGNVPNMRGMSAWFLPGAALFLLSLLRSRRTGNAMVATRPLLAVVSLAPLMSAAMPFLKLRRAGLAPTPGAALGLVAVGVALSVFAALRFGDGVPEARPRARDRDEG